MSVVIVNEIGKVVESMRTDPQVIALINDSTINGLFPFYEPGHPVEIANILKTKDLDPLNKNRKYPLIALKLDSTNTREGGLYKFNLNIAIIMYTDEKYSVKERLDNVFIPILYPLYDRFIHHLKVTGKFTWPNWQDVPPHDDTERFFYGTTSADGNEAYIYDDPLDAIEIQNLRINKRAVLCS